jgi:hypothetical protein
MRPAGLTREEYFGPEPADLLDARRRVEFCLDRMQHAIAERRFKLAQYYSAEDSKARERLRRLRHKYGMA